MQIARVILSATVLYFALLVLLSSPAQAQDLDWQAHYNKAERAYAGHNLFEARREFMLALKEAEYCQQDRELTHKLEALACSYQVQDKQALAQPLFKLARKLKSRFETI